MNLFVIDLHYTAELAEIDALVEDHRSFLREQYAAGLCSLRPVRKNREPVV